jgi:hypothetical protein
MTDSPEVRCLCCLELVSWGQFPEHLAEHGGSMEIDTIAVGGERPTMQTIGEYDTENCVGMAFLTDE